MSELPILSGKEVLRILQRVGYYARDQKGSQIHLRHPTREPLTIPNHRQIARGTLRHIIKEAGLGVEEFLRLR